MEYIQLTLGIVLTITYVWLIIRNSKRSGLSQAIFHFDIMIGIIAGLYLIITSVYSLVAGSVHI